MPRSREIPIGCKVLTASLGSDFPLSGTDSYIRQTKNQRLPPTSSNSLPTAAKCSKVDSSKAHSIGQRVGFECWRSQFGCLQFEADSLITRVIDKQFYCCLKLLIVRRFRLDSTFFSHH